MIIEIVVDAVEFVTWSVIEQICIAKGNLKSSAVLLRFEKSLEIYFVEISCLIEFCLDLGEKALRI